MRVLNKGLCNSGNLPTRYIVMTSGNYCIAFLEWKNHFCRLRSEEGNESSRALPQRGAALTRDVADTKSAPPDKESSGCNGD